MTASPDDAALATARARVVTLLTDRAADDALTPDEFQAWLDRLRDAATARELDAMVRDLAQLPAGDRAVAAWAGAAAPVAPPAAPAAWQGGPPPTRSVTAILGETTRTGPWTLPPRLDVRVVLGTVLLDLRDALLPGGGCEIAVTGVIGQLRLLVRPGVIVEDAVTPVVSTVRNQAEDGGQHPPAAPRVWLTGTAVVTEVEVRVAAPGVPAARAWKEARRARPRR